MGVIRRFYSDYLDLPTSYCAIQGENINRDLFNNEAPKSHTRHSPIDPSLPAKFAFITRSYRWSQAYHTADEITVHVSWCPDRCCWILESRNYHDKWLSPVERPDYGRIALDGANASVYRDKKFLSFLEIPGLHHFTLEQILTIYEIENFFARYRY